MYTLGYKSRIYNYIRFSPIDTSIYVITEFKRGYGNLEKGWDLKMTLKSHGKL